MLLVEINCGPTFLTHSEENTDELFDQTKMYKKIKMLQINSGYLLFKNQDTVDLQQTFTTDICHSLKTT